MTPRIVCKPGCTCKRHGHIARLNKSRTGKPLTPEHRAAIAAGKRGVAQPKGAAAKLGASNPQWRGDDAGHSAIHEWLRRHYPKTGVCEHCKHDDKPTEFAFLHHPEKHTRNRDDYAELCRACHTAMDRGKDEAGRWVA